MWARPSRLCWTPPSLRCSRTWETQTSHLQRPGTHPASLAPDCPRQSRTPMIHSLHKRKPYLSGFSNWRASGRCSSPSLALVESTLQCNSCLWGLMGNNGNVPLLGRRLTHIHAVFLCFQPDENQIWWLSVDIRQFDLPLIIPPLTSSMTIPRVVCSVSTAAVKIERKLLFTARSHNHLLGLKADMSAVLWISSGGAEPLSGEQLSMRDRW